MGTPVPRLRLALRLCICNIRGLDRPYSAHATGHCRPDLSLAPPGTPVALPTRGAPSGSPPRLSRRYKERIDPHSFVSCSSLFHAHRFEVQDYSHSLLHSISHSLIFARSSTTVPINYQLQDSQRSESQADSSHSPFTFLDN